MEPTSVERRQFLKTTAAAAAGAGLLILPGGMLRGQNAPSNKLNVALIGVWGRGLAHYRALKNENVVALCDINEEHLAGALKEFPGAKTYVDWRKCLDQKDIDAVVICTTDHTHAFISNWALNRDMHVYCEKPLAITVNEARLVREKWMTKKNKLATQVGMQRHAFDNFNRVREMILDGAVGELQAVHAWGNRQIRRDGYLPAAGDPPPHLHYDLWLGPSPFHPYNPGYFKGGPGANCLEWNMYWDFGAGQIGDMGSHTMDLAWNGIDATVPNAIEAEGEEFNPDVTPVTMKSTHYHPANSWRGEIPVIWYQGGAMPTSPMDFVDLNRIGHGALFKGSEGFLVAEFQKRMLIPFGKRADMTYYKPRPKDELLPPLGDFQMEWINACKGDLKTSCDFEYSGNMIEQMLLGLVAYRVGKKLEYDGAAGRVTNVPEANAYLTKEYRPGWTLEG